MLDLRAIARTPLLVPSPLEQYLPTPPRRLNVDDLVLASLGEGGGVDDNVVAVLGPEAPERVFDLAGEFFGGNGYSILVEIGQADSLEAVLREQGWELDEEEPALVLAPVPEPPPPPQGLFIVPVSSKGELDAFLSVSETGRRWIPSLEAALDPKVALLVGWRYDRPVATARISCLGEVGDITGVVTLPGERRRGFGTAMTWAAIGEGLRRGCRAMTLTATEMGYPVYCRMGFVPVASYRTYVPPEREAAEQEEPNREASE